MMLADVQGEDERSASGVGWVYERPEVRLNLTYSRRGMISRTEDHSVRKNVKR